MPTKSVFWSDLDHDLDNPSYREHHLREAERIAQIDALVNELDHIRQLQGKSKADVALSADMHPAAVRRLFTQEHSNPTLTTVSEVASALGYRLTLAPLEDEQPTSHIDSSMEEQSV